MGGRTTTTFLERLQSSRLLSRAKIAAATQVAGTDDKALARYLVEHHLLTRFQVRQLFSGASTFHVDRYEILDCIGRGGSGFILKARHVDPPYGIVALKTLDTTSLHHAEEAVARFRREIEILARLEHPNVVRAYRVLHTRSQLYLVLEYLDGRDLASLVKERGPLPVQQAVRYAIHAARGLAYAHGQGIIHRDLKPANLLVTAGGVVKLADLGLARFRQTDQNDELTMKGFWVGTPEFMAPEQAEDATRADERSDLYSLGATLFHLLTAELPVSGSNYMHCLTRLLTQPPRPLREARPDMPVALAQLVDRLRARNVAERPPSAEAVVAELLHLADETAAPEPPAEELLNTVNEPYRSRKTQPELVLPHA